MQAEQLSGLTHIEKAKLERELGMASGYVLNFSTRTFKEFFREVVRIEIYDARYDLGSGSKANRMRAFWQVASEKELDLLLAGLLEAWDLYSDTPIPESAKTLLERILARLRGDDSREVTDKKDQKNAYLDRAISEQLSSDLQSLTLLSPQARGYEFEKYLRDLFDAFGLSARSSFRLIGEQIDGSFVLNNETYLMEAKWQNAQVGAADLHTFEGKIGEKAAWSRGLFVSFSGFSSDGLIAFGRGKRLVCMDGFDLSEMLRLNVSMNDVLEAKVRRAAESGSPFTAVRELFS